MLVVSLIDWLVTLNLGCNEVTKITVFYVQLRLLYKDFPLEKNTGTIAQGCTCSARTFEVFFVLSEISHSSNFTSIFSPAEFIFDEKNGKKLKVIRSRINCLVKT